MASEALSTRASICNRQRFTAFGPDRMPVDEVRLRRRELSLCVQKVELRLYRRTNTSADVIQDPPHCVYNVRCEWTGEQLPPRDAATRCRPIATAPGSLPPDEELGYEFEPPWPWWDSLPTSYVVRRRWHEIVRFHEALANQLAYDSHLGCRRVKARVPHLPEPADVNRWLNSYAATGDACCLSRRPQVYPDQQNGMAELHDLHWIYVRNRLSPYFVDVNTVLKELPTEILCASRSLRRFVTGGVGGHRQPSGMVQPRFLGPLPVQPDREDIAAAVQARNSLKRSVSSPQVLSSPLQSGGRSLTGSKASSGMHDSPPKTPF